MRDDANGWVTVLKKAQAGGDASAIFGPTGTKESSQPSLVIVTRIFYAGSLNSSISCLIFGIVTKTGRPNSAASFSQQIKPASAEVRQIFSAWDVRSVKADRGVGLAP